MDLKPIDQQVIVIFGASSGIGRATALLAARRGAKVVVAARGKPGLDSLVEEVTNAGGEAVPMVADAADSDAVRAVAELASERFGRLDTWAHVAAVSLYAPFQQMTPQEFKRVVDVTLMGQVYGAMAALPHLKREGRGSLVHVSSVIARRGYPLQSAYSAAKHGIDGFLESLRVELRREGSAIGVSQILPASINTPFFDKARTKLGVKPTGPPPVYDPRLVAEAILFAAEHPKRDIVVGGAAKLQLLQQRLSPGSLDAMLLRTGFAAQRTDKQKGEDAPDSLDEAIVNHDTIDGTISDHARRTSAWTWMEQRPVAKAAAAAAAVGTVLVRRSRR